NERYNPERPVRQQPFYDPNYPPVGPNPYQTPFEYYAKPTQPDNWHQFMNNYNYYGQADSNVQNNFMTQFQDANGQVDFQKVLSTVNQLANTVQQVSPIIQQVNSVIKSFR